MAIIDGKKIAGGILEKLNVASKLDRFLAAVLVGEDRSSISFLGQKEKIAKQLGVDFRLYKFPATLKNDKLREEVGKIARHRTCGGVIVQLPLPEHLNWYYILNAIPPEKDVDVLSERTIGAFYAGRSKVLPPAVGTVGEILGSLHAPSFDLDARSVAVVGLGLLVGRPVANWIMRRAKETFLLRSTSDLGILKQADLVITGVGKAGLIKPGMLKAGAGVIDFGYEGGKGDFEIPGNETENAKIDFYTPTPGGTGPILVAKLFENFYTLNGG
ncbi:MAG TPA: bifunctional 5,10-methylenetetrahydrofolate dehydrogenase/5,10-methenyltetrahydrofolate cyclohydrolase [Candidatus Paceibacterota bacterium]|nr:bifunctional 5,10-methylenetetrahydrofolate dehydrogenase/5,10-methenyltetrahydrofolate cyclohydrolase [Candidatus Paceibacterota bacterium]